MRRRDLVVPASLIESLQVRSKCHVEECSYVTDANGERVAVILPIEEYENLLEDLHVIAAAYETKGEPTIPFDDVLAELRASGEIDV